MYIIYLFKAKDGKIKLCLKSSSKKYVKSVWRTCYEHQLFFYKPIRPEIRSIKWQKSLELIQKNAESVDELTINRGIKNAFVTFPRLWRKTRKPIKEAIFEYDIASK